MTTLGASHGAGLRSGSFLVFDAPHIVVNDLLDGLFSLLLDVMLANLAFVLPEATRCNGAVVRLVDIAMLPEPPRGTLMAIQTAM